MSQALMLHGESKGLGKHTRSHCKVGLNFQRKEALCTDSQFCKGTVIIMKTSVAVFYGAASVEHEISVISAVQAMHAFDKEKYELVPVYITKDRRMFTGDALFEMDSYQDMEGMLAGCRQVLISSQNGVGMLYDHNGGLRRRKEAGRFDVAFPIVHGTNGEDGSILFEMLGVPYVGCDVISSALGMDKVRFKHILSAAGLPHLPCVSFTARQWAEEPAAVRERIAQQVGYPLIVKPANLGSSVGISKVGSAEELDEALSLAASFAETLLCERAIGKLREINCSVLGDRDEAEASVCEEPFMEDEILSYTDKYMSGGSSKGAKGMSSLKRKLPADLPVEKAEEIRSTSIRVFEALGCAGVARIDYLLDGENDDRVYVNEINTIPGSLAFYLWEATGVPYKELLDRLVGLALRRARRRGNLMFTYDTNILSMGGFGAKGCKK